MCEISFSLSLFFLPSFYFWWAFSIWTQLLGVQAVIKIKGSLNAKQKYSCHFSLLMLVPENEKRVFWLCFFSCTCAVQWHLELNFLLSCWKPKPWTQIPWWLSSRFLSLVAGTSLRIWPHVAVMKWQIPPVLKFWWAECLEVWLLCQD